MAAGTANPLWPYVRGIHHYDITGRPPGVHVGMPSPTVTMVLPLGAPLDLAMPAIGRSAMGSCVAGLHDHPAAIHHDGSQRGIQIALAPLGLRVLLGIGGAELAGTAAGLGDLVGDRPATRLLDRIEHAGDWPARVAIVQAFLADRLRRADRPERPPPEVVHAWNLLARSGGSARIGDVAAEVGWSTRHLAHRFSAAVGVAPKTAGLLMRFHRSVTMISGGTAPGDVAARCGYADQAHLTREWRRLAGTTPGGWPREDVLAKVQDAGARAGASSTA